MRLRARHNQLPHFRRIDKRVLSNFNLSEAWFELNTVAAEMTNPEIDLWLAEYSMFSDLIRPGFLAERARRSGGLCWANWGKV